MAFISVEDDLPPPGQFVIAYCEPYGVYEIAQFCPARGWVDQTNRKLGIISHWDNAGFYFPFPILSPDEINEESLAKYNLKKNTFGNK